MRRACREHLRSSRDRENRHMAQRRLSGERPTNASTRKSKCSSNRSSNPREVFDCHAFDRSPRERVQRRSPGREPGLL